MTELCSISQVFPEWKKSPMPFYVHKIYTLENPETGDAFQVDVGSANPYSFFTFIIRRKVAQRWTLNALFDMICAKLPRLRRRPDTPSAEAGSHSKTTTTTDTA